VNPLHLITDAYDRKARLYPALLVSVPVVFTVVAILSVKLSALQSAGVALVGCGGVFLLAQLARDPGKKGEPALFARWGGMPSVAIFRHRDTRLDAITKARYHKRLAAVVEGAPAPSPAQEQADPTAADQVYRAWSTYLRVRSRERSDTLVFRENVNYGYRRNVLGLRLVGITTSALSCAFTLAWSYIEYRRIGAIRDELLGAGGLGLGFLLLWAFRFSAGWVRVPAEAYAERLAETAESVGEDTGPKI
jgi:hypothetical protein